MVYQTQAIYQKPSLRPQPSAHLTQTMSLLSLNAAELAEKIEAELAANPALEILPGRYCPTCQRRLPPNLNCPTCSFQANASEGAPVVFVAPQGESYYSAYSSNANDIPFDELSAEHENLGEYVLRQIASELEVEQRPLAAHLLTSLNEDGLLTVPLSEVAIYHHVSVEEVRKVARLIQLAEPVGVGSASPQEALLIQLEVIGERGADVGLARRAIAEGLDLLSRRQYNQLAQKLRVTTTRAQKVAEYIGQNLNPYPARAHWGNVRHKAEQTTRAYERPDVVIGCQGETENPRLVVEILWPIFGMLRVNPEFQQALAEAPQEKAELWQQDAEKASLLVKCLGQRNHTLVRLMEKLAKLQREFILHGDAYLQPVTQAAIAKDLKVHESTVSRAVSSKSVQLPSGQIIPLGKFFDRSLHIRTALRELIENESAPLSDTKLTKLLARQGYDIARRTVAKYRAIEGILPAHMRG